MSRVRTPFLIDLRKENVNFDHDRGKTEKEIDKRLARRRGFKWDNRWRVAA